MLRTGELCAPTDVALLTRGQYSGACPSHGAGAGPAVAAATMCVPASGVPAAALRLAEPLYAVGELGRSVEVDSRVDVAVVGEGCFTASARAYRPAATVKLSSARYAGAGRAQIREEDHSNNVVAVSMPQKQG